MRVPKHQAKSTGSGRQQILAASGVAKAAYSASIADTFASATALSSAFATGAALDEGFKECSQAAVQRSQALLPLQLACTSGHCS